MRHKHREKRQQFWISCEDILKYGQDKSKLKTKDYCKKAGIYIRELEKL